MIVRYGQMHASEVKEKIVRNPNYAGRTVGPFGWKAVPLTPAPNKDGFHAALSTSVRQEGFRNPVVVYRFEEGYFLSFGGSRVCAAQDLGLLIPCIVNDYVDSEVDSEVYPDNVETFFRDPPEFWEFTKYGFDYHYHIEKNRRESYDKAGMKWVDGLDNTDFIEEEFPWLKR